MEKIIKGGEPIAIKIKEAFYLNEPWTPKLAFTIGHKLAKLKAIARPLYQDDMDLLTALGAFSTQDIRDAFDDKEDVCQGNAIGGLMQRSMVDEKS